MTYETVRICICVRERTFVRSVAIVTERINLKIAQTVTVFEVVRICTSVFNANSVKEVFFCTKVSCVQIHRFSGIVTSVRTVLCAGISLTSSTAS